jgi:hypothetical protein
LHASFLCLGHGFNHAQQKLEMERPQSTVLAPAATLGKAKVQLPFNAISYLKTTQQLFTTPAIL